MKRYKETLQKKMELGFLKDLDQGNGVTKEKLILEILLHIGTLDRSRDIESWEKVQSSIFEERLIHFIGIVILYTHFFSFTFDQKFDAIDEEGTGRIYAQDIERLASEEMEIAQTAERELNMSGALSEDWSLLGRDASRSVSNSNDQRMEAVEILRVGGEEEPPRSSFSSLIGISSPFSHQQQHYQERSSPLRNSLLDEAHLQDRTESKNP